jgi:hypothetical protein
MRKRDPILGELALQKRSAAWEGTGQFGSFGEVPFTVVDTIDGPERLAKELLVRLRTDANRMLTKARESLDGKVAGAVELESLGVDSAHEWEAVFTSEQDSRYYCVQMADDLPVGWRVDG